MTSDLAGVRAHVCIIFSWLLRTVASKVMLASLRGPTWGETKLCYPRLHSHAHHRPQHSWNINRYIGEHVFTRLCSFHKNPRPLSPLSLGTVTPETKVDTQHTAGVMLWCLMVDVEANVFETCWCFHQTCQCSLCSSECTQNVRL